MTKQEYIGLTNRLFTRVSSMSKVNGFNTIYADEDVIELLDMARIIRDWSEDNLQDETP